MDEDETEFSEEVEELGAADASPAVGPVLRESGLARSIRSMFEESGAEPSAPDGSQDPEEGGAERPGEDEDEEGSRPSRGSIRDAFTTSVAKYLQATPDERDRLVGGILSEARRLRRAQEIRAVSDAAATLALHGRDRDDEAARALALELMDPAVVSHLAVRVAIDPDVSRREVVREVCGVFPAVFAPALTDALPEAPDRASRRTFMDVLVELGDHGRRAVVDLLEDPRVYAVRDAVELLPEMAGREAVQDLTSILGHDDPRLRRETLRALARIGGEAAGLLILGMLEDPEPEVRAAAAEGAGELRLARAQRPLAELLERETDESVTVAVVEALGRIRDPGSVPAIEKRAGGSLFARPARPVRLAAYRALSEIGTPDALRIVEGAASDRDREVREAVRELLERGERVADEGVADEGVPDENGPGGSVPVEPSGLGEEPSGDLEDRP